MLISDNGISKVELRDDGFIYKTQPKFLTDNEIWILQLLRSTGYVPKAEQVDIETIKMNYILPMPVTNPDVLMYHFARVLRMLEDYQLRHGDLTIQNIIINQNKPYIIDWSESRLACDPRPNKRPESDEYWLRKSFEDLCNAT